MILKVPSNLDDSMRGRRKRPAGEVGQEELFWTCWAARSRRSKAVWVAGGEVKQHELKGLNGQSAAQPPPVQLAAAFSISAAYADCFGEISTD